jgi:hypothetical protein
MPKQPPLDEAMSFLAPLRQKIESWLYALGFAQPVVRQHLCAQILLCGFALLAGVLFFRLTLWPLAFAAGACIAAFSLWHIARFAQAHAAQEFSLMLGLKLFFSFSGRFLLIGVALFALIAWLEMPIIPLVIGLSSTVAGIAAWGVARRFRKTVKEA